MLKYKIDSPRMCITTRLARKAPRKAPMKEFCRRVTFWYGLVGSSSRLGSAGTRLERKSISEKIIGMSLFKITLHFS